MPIRDYVYGLLIWIEIYIFFKPMGIFKDLQPRELHYVPRELFAIDIRLEWLVYEIEDI